MPLQEKVQEAEKVLKLAAEISKAYYHAPLIICYSGGKDSDVLLHIAMDCLKPDDFEVLNSHTTVDAPETVYHIRDVFKELNEKGIKTTIRMPRYKDKPTSMWQLIVDKGTYPTRYIRFCCSVLKESGTPNRAAAVGVREDESLGRRGRDVFGTRGKTKKDGRFYSFEHIKEQFESSLKVTAELGTAADVINAYDCQFIENAKKNNDVLVNPIYSFTDADVWAYIKNKGIKTNPLYSRGYKRVGCVGCPLAGPEQMMKEFADYPKYKQNYIKAFDRLIEKRRKAGHPFDRVDNGEELMKHWLGIHPKQIDINDLLEQEGGK